jgi:transposase
MTSERNLEAVRRIKDGEILRNVAADFDVDMPTVSDWVKSKSKLEEHSSKMPNVGTLQPKNVVKKQVQTEVSDLFRGNL